MNSLHVSREDILPPDAPEYGEVVNKTIRDSVAKWPPSRRPAAGAPNIVVILLDDLGFGQISSYGGPIEAPNIARLAAGGLRYSNFHTTSLCSPSRAALMTGRNHHSVGFSAIAEMATGFPGSHTYLPKSAVTIAEVLRQHGYATMCSGKWHLTPMTESTAAGPFERWPLGQGFERFYGFMGGETDHWHPMLTVDNHRTPIPERDGYHLSEDLTDQAIRMIRDQQQVATGRPFFLYMPFGAPHGPFHVAPEWIEKYKGRFAHGWDRERELTLERQIKLGIVPANTVLPPRNAGIKAWDELDEDARRLFERMQETFCGFVDHCDAQIGRLVKAIEQLGQLDNTLILFLSDNGASQEGGENGLLSAERFRNFMPMSVAEMLPRIDEIGSASTGTMYPAGWAMAGNTPFQRWKRDTHRGGNTDPLIVHWPAQIKDGGGIRAQYTHITDIYPTLLEVLKLPVPTRVNGVDQIPLEGQSLAYTFGDANAPRQRSVQYYEMLGSRALWQDGWTAVTFHKPNTNWEDDPWELYHQDEDFSQARNLAAQHPERLKALIDEWWVQAEKHKVLPLDDRFLGRVVDPKRPRPYVAQPLYTYWPDTSPVPAFAAPRTLNHAHRVTVFVEIPAQGPEPVHGVLAAFGANHGGWSFHIEDGRLHYLHNPLELGDCTVSSPPLALSPGRHLLAYAFTPTAPDKGLVELFVDDVSQGPVEAVSTAPLMYSAGLEGLQIGRLWGPPVSPRLREGAQPFSGLLEKVTLVLPPDAPVFWPLVPGAK